MAELANGGRSTTAARVLGEHAPGGGRDRDVLALEQRRTRASTSASASSIPGRSLTVDHDNPAEMTGRRSQGGTGCSSRWAGER